MASGTEEDAQLLTLAKTAVTARLDRTGLPRVEVAGYFDPQGEFGSGGSISLHLRPDTALALAHQIIALLESVGVPLEAGAEPREQE